MNDDHSRKRAVVRDLWLFLFFFFFSFSFSALARQLVYQYVVMFGIDVCVCVCARRGRKRAASDNRDGSVLPRAPLGLVRMRKLRGDPAGCVERTFSYIGPQALTSGFGCLCGLFRSIG